MTHCPYRELTVGDATFLIRTGPFNTPAHEASEDPKRFIHPHQPSILKRILSMGRFRLPKTPSPAPLPLPSTQYHQKNVSVTTVEDVPTEPKPATNVASPEIKSYPTSGRSSADDYLKLGVEHVVRSLRLDPIPSLAVSSASPSH